MKCAALCIAVMITVGAADNCMKAGDAWPMQLKKTLTALVCDDGTSEGESCGNCCETTPGTCAALKDKNTKCDEKTGSDETKYSVEAVAATYIEKCCTAKQTCKAADICVKAGMKDKTNAATLMGRKMKVHASEVRTCCDDNPLTCFGGQAAATTASKGCDAAKQEIDKTKYATTVSADYSDFKAKCCIAKASPVKCSVACPAATHVKKANYANITKPGPTALMASECCDDKPGTCKVASGTGKCKAKRTTDKSKNGKAALADGTDYDANCCIDKFTCAAFKTATTGGTLGAASRANTQEASTAMLLLMLSILGGSLAQGK